MAIGTTLRSATLAEQAIGQRLKLPVIVRNGLLVLVGSLFVALCAQIRIPLPFTPVPLTGQTLGVLLVGTALGPQLGGLAMLLYLLEGAIGLPFYAGGTAGWEVLRGATAGYLWAFPLAALLCGWLARRGWDRNVIAAAALMLLGNLVIYLLGAGWLASHIGFTEAIAKGVLPFLIGDLLKIVLAALTLPGAWALLKRD